MFNLVRPCESCPFRRDIAPYLPRERVREIWRSLDRGTFWCHHTIDWTNEEDESGEYAVKGIEQHCAGALIMLHKTGRYSQMMRIAYRLGWFDPDKLDLAAPVYESVAAMIRAQER